MLSKKDVQILHSISDRWGFLDHPSTIPVLSDHRLDTRPNLGPDHNGKV